MGTQSLQFRYNRRLFWVGIPVAVLALAVGLYMTYTEWPGGPDLAQGVLVVAFASLFLVWLLKTWSDRSVIVEIGPGGVYDRRLSDKPIPWNAIVAIRSYDVWDSRLLRWLGTAGGVRGGGATNRFAGLIVETPLATFRPRNPLVRMLTRLTSWMTGYPLLSINMSPLDGTHADLITALREFAPSERIKVDP